MLKKYPKFKRGEVEKIYKKLPQSEKKFLKNYLDYRRSRGLGESSILDLRRYYIQVRHIIQCDFKKFDTLEKAVKLSLLIDNSGLSGEVKKNLKINLKNLFKYVFPDWSIKFMGLECLDNRNNKGEGSEEGKISNGDLPTDEEIEKMLKSENSLFWKTFLLTQHITGLRTGEVRKIKIEKIIFNKDKTATIEIFQSKTGKIKIVFVDVQTSEHIKKLLEEKKNREIKSKFLFHSPINHNKEISKNGVNQWFRNLSQKAIGRVITPYSLRHKRATTLYEMAQKNLISNDAVLRLLGHSRDVSNRYIHTPKEEEIEILKKQFFNIEVSPEKKNEYEVRIEELENQMKFINEKLERIEKMRQLVEKSK